MFIAPILTRFQNNPDPPDDASAPAPTTGSTPALAGNALDLEHFAGINALALANGPALLGGLEIWRGHATAFSIGALITFAAAGLFTQFRLRPVIQEAWDELRKFDTGT